MTEPIYNLSANDWNTYKDFRRSQADRNPIGNLFGGIGNFLLGTAAMIDRATPHGGWGPYPGSFWGGGCCGNNWGAMYDYTEAAGWRMGDIMGLYGGGYSGGWGYDSSTRNFLDFGSNLGGSNWGNFGSNPFGDDAPIENKYAYLAKLTESDRKKLAALEKKITSIKNSKTPDWAEFEKKVDEYKKLQESIFGRGNIPSIDFRSGSYDMFTNLSTKELKQIPNTVNRIEAMRKGLAPLQSAVKNAQKKYERAQMACSRARSQSQAAQAERMLQAAEKELQRAQDNLQKEMENISNAIGAFQNGLSNAVKDTKESYIGIATTTGGGSPSETPSGGSNSSTGSGSTSNASYELKLFDDKGNSTFNEKVFNDWYRSKGFQGKYGDRTVKAAIDFWTEQLKKTKNGDILKTVQSSAFLAALKAQLESTNDKPYYQQEFLSLIEHFAIDATGDESCLRNIYSASSTDINKKTIGTLWSFVDSYNKKPDPKEPSGNSANTSADTNTPSTATSTDGNSEGKKTPEPKKVAKADASITVEYNRMLTKDKDKKLAEITSNVEIKNLPDKIKHLRTLAETKDTNGKNYLKDEDFATKVYEMLSAAYKGPDGKIDYEKLKKKLLELTEGDRPVLTFVEAYVLATKTTDQAVIQEILGAIVVNKGVDYLKKEFTNAKIDIDLPIWKHAAATLGKQPGGFDKNVAKLKDLLKLLPDNSTTDEHIADIAFEFFFYSAGGLGKANPWDVLGFIKNTPCFKYADNREMGLKQKMIERVGMQVGGWTTDLQRCWAVGNSENMKYLAQSYILEHLYANDRTKQFAYLKTEPPNLIGDARSKLINHDRNGVRNLHPMVLAFVVKGNSTLIDDPAKIQDVVRGAIATNFNKELAKLGNKTIFFEGNVSGCGWFDDFTIGYKDKGTLGSDEFTVEHTTRSGYDLEAYFGLQARKGEEGSNVLLKAADHILTGVEQ